MYEYTVIIKEWYLGTYNDWCAKNCSGEWEWMTDRNFDNDELYDVICFEKLEDKAFFILKMM